MEKEHYSLSQKKKTIFRENVTFTKFLPKNGESKLRTFTLTLFWQRFRESNGFTNKMTE